MLTSTILTFVCCGGCVYVGVELYQDSVQDRAVRDRTDLVCIRHQVDNQRH